MGFLDFLRPKRKADQPAVSDNRPTFQLKEVFTPGQPANAGFVSRPVQERDLKDLLDEPGTQIVVWGESGAGKSSLVTNVLRAENQEFIVTRCVSTTTYPQVLASAFDQIEAMRRAGATNQDTRTIGGGTEIGGPLSPATVSAHADWEMGRTDDFAPVVDAQVTAEALAKRLGRRGLVWVIEDFHKVSIETREQLSDAMKVFSDESVNHDKFHLIVLGVAESAGLILQAPANMDGRLADIELPPLSDDELLALLDKGRELLNVNFAEVQDSIVRNSVGVASMTHALASECCRAVDVRETSAQEVQVTAADLETARSAYLRKRGGSMKSDFDAALEQVAMRKYHNYAIILRALATFPEQGATHAQLFARIRDEHPDYPAGNLTTYLRALQMDERKNLVRKTAEGLFRYDRPLQHGYAMMRFKVAGGSTDQFWTKGLAVSEEDQERSVQLAIEENPNATEN